MNSDLKITILADSHIEEKKMNEGGLKIPFQNSPFRQFRQPEEKIIRREPMEKTLIPLFLLCGILFLFYYAISNCVDVAYHMTSYKPQIQLESVYVCPVSIPNKSDVWVLTFNITNLNNHTLLCIDRSEASIFSNNRTDLLAQGGDLHETCVEPLSYTSMNVTFISEEPPNQLDWGDHGSVRLFDLKVRSRFNHIYRHEATHSKMGEVVCRDAKIAFLTSSNSSASACGTMRGDPPQCSFEAYFEY